MKFQYPEGFLTLLKTFKGNFLFIVATDYFCEGFKNNLEQVCIPVGCVPPSCWLYLPACTAHGEVSAPGGVCSWGRGVCSQGGCVCSQGCLLPVGCLLLGGGASIQPCTEANPHSTVNRMTNRQVSKHNLHKLRLRAIINVTVVHLNVSYHALPSSWLDQINSSMRFSISL